MRVPDLRGFRRAIANLATPTTIVVVPTRAAGRQLLHSWHQFRANSSIAGPTPATGPTRQFHGPDPARQLRATDLTHVAGPAPVIRDELYDLFHARLSQPPRRLTVIERDVIAQASARSACAPIERRIRLRLGLIAEMLRFYDHLRRQSQSVTRFEELIQTALGSSDRSPDPLDLDIDRGARRMRQQTQFLADAFREYERRVHQSGACDEHTLREQLIAEPSPHPVRHIIVTLADWIASAEGLFVADFDLLSRIPGLEFLDVIATEKLLQSGFHQRLHTWLPGIDEVEWKSLGPNGGGASGTQLGPNGGGASGTQSTGQSHEPWSTYRDREEELVAVARQLKSDRRNGSSVVLDRVGVVYKRPLPYLYLARDVFGSAGIPFQTGDTLPLAAEPTSAALDLILEAVEANFTRSTTVALLRSPHFRFTLDRESSEIGGVGNGEGEGVSREAVAALDRALSAARYLGDPARLGTFAETWKDARSAPALHLAIRVTRELAPLAEQARASVHVRHLAAFWERHLRSIDGDRTELASRERRARAAISDTLNALAAVHATHDDPSWTVEDLALAVRRCIEEQTVEVDPADRGLQLLDDNAARYGDFDDLTVVGLIEPEWPERPKRNIFYPSSLLKALGWPSERERQASAEANFQDLVASPSRRTILSTFTLDDDALVSRSLLLDAGVPTAAPAVRRGAGVPTAAPAAGATLASRVFMDEALSLDPVSFAPLDARAQAWASLRASRTPCDSARYHGVLTTAVDQPGSLDRNVRPWSVSALETYLGCPFRFFAQHILKLDEEPDDEEVMDPRRQGQFLHEVFEEFFAAWQSAGYGAIDSNNIDEARRMFTAVVDRKLTELPGAEAGLERTRLLGSPAAAGLGEAVMRMEAERPIPVIDRLLEHELRGEFTFTTSGGPRRIALRGKADRVDLLADGTFRLVDYKLGWPPDRKKALQLPVYSLCAEQWLRANRGGDWSMSEAAYLAFKGPRRVVPLFQSDADRDKVLAEAQDRLAQTIDAIARGQFPPAPDDVYRCETCGYSTVCRKDYVGDV